MMMRGHIDTLTLIFIISTTDYFSHVTRELMEIKKETTKRMRGVQKLINLEKDTVQEIEEGSLKEPLPSEWPQQG